MTMHKKILYILSLMGLFSFAACTNEESPLLSEGTGEIRFSVVDTTEIEIATRASYYFDVNKFNVSLNRGSEPIFSDKKYGDLVGKTKRKVRIKVGDKHVQVEKSLLLSSKMSQRL